MNLSKKYILGLSTLAVIGLVGGIAKKMISKV